MIPPPCFESYILLLCSVCENGLVRLETLGQCRWILRLALLDPVRDQSIYTPYVRTYARTATRGSDHCIDSTYPPSSSTRPDYTLVIGQIFWTSSSTSLLSCTHFGQALSFPFLRIRFFFSFLLSVLTSVLPCCLFSFLSISAFFHAVIFS